MLFHFCSKISYNLSAHFESLFAPLLNNDIDFGIPNCYKLEIKKEHFISIISFLLVFKILWKKVYSKDINSFFIFLPPFHLCMAPLHLLNGAKRPKRRALERSPGQLATEKVNSAAPSEHLGDRGSEAAKKQRKMMGKTKNERKNDENH